MTTVCSKCGSSLAADVLFCPQCGTPTSSSYSNSGVSPYDPTAASFHSSAPQHKPATNYGSPPYGVPPQNPYEPLNLYQAPLRPPPPPLQRRGNRTWLIVGTVVLVCVIVVGGVVALLRSGAQGSSSPHSPTIAPTQATATAQAHIMATATAENSNPYPPGGGTLALNDSLRDNSSLNFGEASISGITCQFTKGAYHVATTGQSTALCVAPATDFSNFVYEVQMTIIKGDAGGVFFRADWNSKKLYFFYVSVAGTYGLILYTDSSHTKSLTNAALSAAIHRGLNQTNLIAVGANGNTITLYINHQLIDSVNDSTYSHGQIGLGATAFVNSVDPTEVAYNNAKVWTLP